MDAHEELEHRAQVINDRLKANPASPTRTQSGNIKRKVASPPRPQQTEPEKKTVTINPIPLPSSLSDIMRACIEYVSLLVNHTARIQSTHTQPRLCGCRYLAQPWALTEVGLFRVSGNKRKILEYIDKFDTASKTPGAKASLADCFEPATVCGLLKVVLQRERLPLSPWEGQNITSLVMDSVATDELKVISPDVCSTPPHSLNVLPLAGAQFVCSSIGAPVRAFQCSQVNRVAVFQDYQD